MRPGGLQRGDLADWPAAPVLRGRGVWLEPLRVEHAQEMAPLLGDPALHAYTGGKPPTPSELEATYRRQATEGSPDGSQRWLNWVVRRDDGQPVGTVQATVSRDGDGFVAEVAWVVATAHQRQGYAREAARVMCSWLRRRGATVIAHIHPGHEASAAVARGLGLAPTQVQVDGEDRWQSCPQRHH